MQDALPDLCGAFGILAANGDFLIRTEERMPTGRAGNGKEKFPLPACSQGGQTSRDLWDDISSLFNQDPVSDANILPAYLIFVVKRGTGYARSRKKNRFKHSHWSDHSRAPHLEYYIQQTGFRLFRGKLVCDNPSRRLGGGTEGGMKGAPVDFDNQSVGVVVETFTAGLPLFSAKNDFLDACAEAIMGVDRNPEHFKEGEEFVMGWGKRQIGHSDGIAEEGEGP